MKFIQSKNKEFKFRGTLVIQADKNINYEVLKKILYTAGMADYRIFKFMVIEKGTTI